MLTCAPAPDLAPYHARQILVLDRADGLCWIDTAVPAGVLLRPSPAGSLATERMG